MIAEGYNWNDYAPCASQATSSSGPITPDDTYAENQSARNPSSQWSGEENTQTNTRREQVLLERIRISNVRKIELIDRKCAQNSNKFLVKVADKRKKAQAEFRSISHNARSSNCVRCKPGVHVHSGAYLRDQRRQSDATKSGT